MMNAAAANWLAGLIIISRQLAASSACLGCCRLSDFGLQTYYYLSIIKEKRTTPPTPTLFASYC
jgi:hypothetical protein